MRKPWMKWYPSDWRGDPRLRMCSLAARGLWADLISYMHEGEPYGHLTINGRAPKLDEISRLVGCTEREIEKAFGELARHQVFSISEAGVMFSRRMVRDAARSDEGREQVKKRWGNRSPNRSPNISPTETPNTYMPDARKKEHVREHASAREAKSLISESARSIAEEIAAIAGFPTPLDWPPGWMGAPGRVQVMLAQGWNPEIMFASAREVMAKKRDGPPDSIRYFERAFAKAHAQQAAPLPVVEVVNNPQKVQIHAAANGGGNTIRGALDRLRAASEGGISGGGEDAPRLLPDRRG